MFSGIHRALSDPSHRTVHLTSLGFSAIVPDGDHMRVRRKLRSVLQTLGILGAVTSGVLAGSALLGDKKGLWGVAGVYAACSIVLLLAWQVLSFMARQHRRSGAAQEVAKHTSTKETQGIVLVLVLLMVALVATLIVQAQVLAGAGLRRASRQDHQAKLRLAAADAAWYYLRQAALKASKSPGEVSLSVGRKDTLPSGVETEVTTGSATNVDEAALAMLGGKTVARELYLVESAASLSGKTERVSCLVKKIGGRNLRVLGWLERR